MLELQAGIVCANKSLQSDRILSLPMFANECSNSVFSLLVHVSQTQKNQNQTERHQNNWEYESVRRKDSEREGEREREKYQNRQKRSLTLFGTVSDEEKQERTRERKIFGVWCMYCVIHSSPESRERKEKETRSDPTTFSLSSPVILLVFAKRPSLLEQRCLTLNSVPGTRHESIETQTVREREKRERKHTKSSSCRRRFHYHSLPPSLPFPSPSSSWLVCFLVKSIF